MIVFLILVYALREKESLELINGQNRMIEISENFSLKNKLRLVDVMVVNICDI